jgi:dynein light intermediate chain 1, cytosolic
VLAPDASAKDCVSKVYVLVFYHMPSLIVISDGAALFYSSQVPATTAVLRQYALHYLFTPTPPQASIGSTDAPAPVRNIFKFAHPANALDRDRIVIPAGWDSWGKIKILRDDFDPIKWADAWDKDMESFALAPAIPPSSSLGFAGSTPSLPTTEATLAPPIHQGARSYFKLLVGPDRGPAPRSLPALIQPIPEQTFLQQHYETLAKDPARDPRDPFRQPAVPVDGTAISSSAGGSGGAGGVGVGVGVVGPLASISFNLPSVTKALDEMEGGSERDRERDRPQERERDHSGISSRPPVAGTTRRGVSNSHRALAAFL